MKGFLFKYKYFLITAITLLVIVMKIISLLYIENPYHPENFSIEQLNLSQSEVKVIENKDYFEIAPTNDSPINKDKGVIFYPGAHVKAESYVAHMMLLTKAGNIHTFIVKVPLNYAILNTNAGQKVIEANNKISKWYIGGHSLGGVAASQFVSGQQKNEKVKGLFFWASYPGNSSLKTNQTINILGIYGAKDAFVSKEEVETAKSRLPEDAQIITLDGITHSQFGDYGKQKGDNDPDISNSEARQKITEVMVLFINK